MTDIMIEIAKELAKTIESLAELGKELTEVVSQNKKKEDDNGDEDSN